ncbi:hypothetical protein BSKO_12656 [Bryopsis sp. KO-2023]|nr:hypothetical protein BSKO_12656 [Bryopsis sp. KO-2023]
MMAQTFLVVICALAFVSFAGAADLPPCDFFKIPQGYLEASGGAKGNIRCTQWKSLSDARIECLSTRGCDGFSFGKSGAAYGGCLKKNREAGYNGNKKYSGFHKNIMGCCGGDKYKLKGDGQCVNTVEKLVSLKKHTVQSTTDFGGKSSRAVDGNKNSNYFAGSCTHTRKQKNPWWQVDLGGPYQITRVVITNRGDCCWGRLSNFEIRIGKELDSNLNKACVTGAKLGRAETRKFECEMEGQYVNIKILGTQFLTLCEVQVFAMVPAADGELVEALMVA